jgi:hypothetical protein
MTYQNIKWINQMAPRLWAARKLMKHAGVLIVSIRAVDEKMKQMGKYAEAKHEFGDDLPRSQFAMAA